MINPKKWKNMGSGSAAMKVPISSEEYHNGNNKKTFDSTRVWVDLRVQSVILLLFLWPTKSMKYALQYPWQWIMKANKETRGLDTFTLWEQYCKIGHVWCFKNSQMIAEFTDWSWFLLDPLDLWKIVEKKIDASSPYDMT